MFEIVSLSWREIGLQSQPCHTENGIYWSTNLMAHHGQKIALGVFGGFGCISRLFAQPAFSR